jgi:hypothetical protein
MNSTELKKKIDSLRRTYEQTIKARASALKALNEEKEAIACQIYATEQRMLKALDSEGKIETEVIKDKKGKVTAIQLTILK